MNIRMFNCYFGDCFCLESENQRKNVYIDFGIHKKVSDKNAESNIEQIANRIITEKVAPDFLLTHYHYDHYSGLLNIIDKLDTKTSIRTPIFDKFYLPDIWNFGDCSAISVCILEDILKNYKLSSKKYSIYELVKFLLSGVNDLVFVSRGMELDFEEKSQALWPRVDKVSIRARRLMKSFETLGIIDTKFTKDLRYISEELRDIVLSYNNMSQDVLREITGMTDEFILNHREKLEKLNVVVDATEDAEGVTCLNEFGNSISIVFQNMEDGNRNYLFTGDITKSCMNFIKKDKTYPIHNKFYYIKIPHHGTENTYYNFTCYKPNVVMIPNGECCADSYKISAKYVDNFWDNAKVYCSNTDWCKGKTGTEVADCKCINKGIICPQLSKVLV